MGRQLHKLIVETVDRRNSLLKRIGQRLFLKASSIRAEDWSHDSIIVKTT